MSSTRLVAVLRFLLPLFALVVLVPASGLAPEPDPVPSRWQLQIRPDALRVSYVETIEGGGAYAYLTYTATNNTGTDLEFVPSFTLSTDSGLSQLSGLGVPTVVTQEIIQSLENPFLEDQIEILGPIQQGPENAKHGIAIWPIRDFDADELRVFAAGFSGETERIELTDVSTGEIVELVFRKTLMMRFGMPGEIRVDAMGDDGLRVLERRWIMR